MASDQFSLAIGRNGQDVRLASQLTGWKISVKDEGGAQELSSEDVIAESVKEEVAPEEKTQETEPVVEKTAE